MSDQLVPVDAVSAGAEAPSELGGGRLRGAVLLGGGVGMSELRRLVERPILDLPVEPGLSILGLWEHEAQRPAFGPEGLAIRVLVDAEATLSAINGSGHTRITLERDRSEYRGTGGALRDACETYDDDDVVLIGPAHQVLLEPLDALARELTTRPADVAILASDDGVPSALIVARVRAIRQIRRIGFVDFKEQALPDLAKSFDVRVVRRSRAPGMPVRTLDGYIEAVRAHHRRKAGQDPAPGPFAEVWRSSFGLIETGASLAADVRVHDSIVLRGATVGPRAVLVRSLVSTGAVVAAGEVVADRIVARRSAGSAS